MTEQAKSPPQPAMSVEQCDIDRATQWWLINHELPVPQNLIVTFARHRHSAAPPVDGVLREAMEALAPFERIWRAIEAVQEIDRDAHLSRWLHINGPGSGGGTYLDESEVLTGYLAARRMRQALSASAKAPTDPASDEGLREALQHLLDGRAGARDRARQILARHASRSEEG